MKTFKFARAVAPTALAIGLLAAFSAPALAADTSAKKIALSNNFAGFSGGNSLDQGRNTCC